MAGSRNHDAYKTGKSRLGFYAHNHDRIDSQKHDKLIRETVIKEERKRKEKETNQIFHDEPEGKGFVMK